MLEKNESVLCSLRSEIRSLSDLSINLFISGKPCSVKRLESQANLTFESSRAHRSITFSKVLSSKSRCFKRQERYCRQKDLCVKSQDIPRGLDSLYRQQSLVIEEKQKRPNAVRPTRNSFRSSRNDRRRGEISA